MPNLLKRAQHLLRHPDELMHLLGDALRKAYANRKILFKVFRDFLLLFRFVKAWALGEYHDAPRISVLWAVLAILYFINPIDLIPDVLPGGYIDDIAFIAYVVRRIRGDLDKYTVWEEARAQAKKILTDKSGRGGALGNS
jgi:uncharacterized membrane protein YkvA (DUF1232 family)